MAHDTTIDGYYLNSDGAWSQTSSGNTNNVSTPASEDGIITFVNKNLDKAVRDIINKPTGALYKSDVAKITKLSAVGSYQDYISNLSGIENLINLQSLDLDFNQIKDISALRGLTNLKYLNLCFTQISEISALKGLTNLQTLGLYFNQIKDISALKGLTNLQTLDLIGNPISDTDKQPLKDALPKCSIKFY